MASAGVHMASARRWLLIACCAGIDAIITADFLSAEQKADILCNNAARFLRLDAGICQR